MGKASPAIAAFNAGEFAPQMEGRTDVEKYAIAAHIQQNFLPLKQGPSMYRQGTAFAQAVRNAANRTWLVRFEYSQTQAFVLEFGNLYVRFYTLHAPLLSVGNAAWNAATAYVLGNQVVAGGMTYYCTAPNTNVAPPNAAYWYPMTAYQGGASAIYEIPSPYLAADLTDALGEFTLQIKQSGDVLYIAAGAATAVTATGYPPFTLTRYANNPPNWQFARYAPVDGPFSSAVPLVQGQKTALAVSAASGNGITITAVGYAPPFAATDVGRLVRIASQTFNVTPWSTQAAFAAGATCSNNGNNYVALNAATTGGSPPVHTSGAVLDGPTGVRWLYTDSGYGIAQITGFTNAGSVTANVLLQFPANCVGSSAAITAASAANPCVLTVANAFVTGEALFVTGVTGMTQLNNNVYTNGTANGASVTLAGTDSRTFSAYTAGGTVYGNYSVEWQLGAWSNTTEWPRAVDIFKDRLYWAGRLTLWGSVPGLYNSHAQDFNGQVTTDAATNNTVSGGDCSNIAWLSAAQILLIGSQGGEYGLDAANYSSAPLGPANIEILRQSQWRVRAIRPELAGTSVLYVQRAGRKVMAMDYNFYLNRYDSTDQSKYSYHITVGGVTQIAMQQEPFEVLWCVRADGTLLSYTFNREDNVTAWARHNLGGNGIVESICVIPAPDGLRDELWMVVNRTIAGVVTRTVEYLTKHFEGPQGGYAGDALASAWYVDCGVQYQSPTFATIAGAIVQFSTTGQTIVVSAANGFKVGQVVTLAGMQYTGTFNPNISWSITAANSTGFTAVNAQFGNLGSFQYVSGGTATQGSQQAGTTTITGIPAVLCGQTVSILADGNVLPQQTVSAAGTLTLPGVYALVTLGFSYQGNLVPMRFEGGADVGTAQGKMKKGQNLVLRLVDSGGTKVGQLSNINTVTGVYQDPLGVLNQQVALLENVRYNSTTTPLDSPPPLQSGDFPVSFPSNANSDQDDRDFYVLVQQSAPLPTTVVGLYPSYKVEDPQ
jgi:hypothetical protein